MRVIGVDLGIRKLALATWDDDLLVETHAYESKAGSRELELMECADWLYDYVYHDRPHLVVIEDNLVGNNVKYSIKLAQMMGACLLRLAEVGEIRSLDVITVNVSQWKKEVLGKGNANKDTVTRYLLERDSAYAELCGHDQDRFDAACIGYYGVQLARKAEVLANPR